MILDILLTWVITIISFALGYYLGQGKKIQEVFNDIGQLKRTIARRTTAVGPVNRPSAEKVIQWTKPKQEEEDEAFKESFIKQTGRKP